MALPPVSPLFQQFVEDELLRAPLLFDQLVEATADVVRRSMASMPSVQRTAVGDLLQALKAQQSRMGEYFMHSLGEQVQSELARLAPKPVAKAQQPFRPQTLSLVDEDEVAVDVEISHAIQTIKSVAEYELRELQAFVAAIAGDLDVIR